MSAATATAFTQKGFGLNVVFLRNYSPVNFIDKICVMSYNCVAETFTIKIVNQFPTNSVVVSLQPFGMGRDNHTV